MGISADLAENLPFGALDSLLGTMTDWKLSQQVDLHVVEVYNRREELGIPAFGAAEDREASRSQRVYWTPEMDAALGKAPDWLVAYRLGVLASQVQERRGWLGVPFWVKRYWPSSKAVKSLTKEARRRIYNARRRHRWEGVLDDLTYKQWKFVVEFFEGRCAYCGWKQTFLSELTEDHLVPLREGGPRTVLNILPACKSCNSSKGARQAYLWIRSRFRPERAQAIEAKIVEYLALIRKEEPFGP